MILHYDSQQNGAYDIHKVTISLYFLFQKLMYTMFLLWRRDVQECFYILGWSLGSKNKSLRSLQLLPNVENQTLPFEIEFIQIEMSNRNFVVVSGEWQYKYIWSCWYTEDACYRWFYLYCRCWLAVTEIAVSLYGNYLEMQFCFSINGGSLYLDLLAWIYFINFPHDNWRSEQC